MVEWGRVEERSASEDSNECVATEARAAACASVRPTAGLRSSVAPGDAADVARYVVRRKPGCAARPPGFLFVCVAHASCAVPRWRNWHTHVPQKHGDPGSNPGWGTRFSRAGARARAPLRHCVRAGGMLFDNLDVATARRRSRRQAGCISCGRSSRESATAPPSEMRVRSSLAAPRELLDFG